AASGDARGIYQSTAASNIEIRNNLVVVTKTGTGNKVALIYSTAGSTINSNNNVLWVTPNTAGYSIGATGTSAGAYRATLQDWQAEGYDNASVVANPQLADRNNNNFQPTNSGANNIGAYVGVDEDIFGNIRSFNNPDPGAIEWEPAGNDA